MAHCKTSLVTLIKGDFHSYYRVADCKKNSIVFSWTSSASRSYPEVSGIQVLPLCYCHYPHYSYFVIAISLTILTISL